jgi:GTPase SAR1 family protein
MPTRGAAVIGESCLRIWRAYERVYAQSWKSVLQEDAAERIEVLAGVARALSAAGRRGGGRRELGERSGELLDEVRESIEQVKGLARRLDEPFLLFVMGTGKCGKSTLINVLLGQKAAEVGVLPRTWKIDVFVLGGEEQQCTLRFVDGREERMGAAEARAYLEEEERRARRSLKEMNARLREEASRYEPEALEELRQFLRRRMLYVSPVVEARWSYSRRCELSDFCIVDTPGLVQELEKSLQESVSDYYHKADGVLWLLDAANVSGKATQEALDEFDRAGGAPGENRERIIGVVNKIDRIRDPEDLGRVMDKVEEIFGQRMAAIVPLSAKAAWKHLRAEDGEDGWDGNREELLGVIDRWFRPRAAMVKARSKARGMQAVLERAAERIEAFLEGLSADEAELVRRRGALAEDIEGAMELMSGELRRILRCYSDETGKRIAAFARSYAEISQGLLRRWLDSGGLAEDRARMQKKVQEEVFERALLDAAVEEFTERLREDIRERTAYWQEQVLFSRFQHLDSTALVRLGVDLPGVSLPANVGLFEIGAGAITIAGAAVAAMMLGPIGAIGAIVLSGFVGDYLKRSQIEHVEQQLRGKLSGIVSGVEKALIEQMRSEYAQMQQALEARMAESFAGIWVRPERISRLRRRLEGSLPALRSPVRRADPKRVFVAIAGEGGRD